jgi:hypothetical protein
LQLRLFQTLGEISSENSSTVILPVPMDLFRPYLGTGNGSQAAAQPEARRDEEEPERLYDEAMGEVRGADEAL